MPKPQPGAMRLFLSLTSMPQVPTQLFGTYHLPKDAWPAGYGIPGHPVPLGYMPQFAYPFSRAIEKAQRTNPS